MSISKKEVKKIAELAQLKLTEKEIKENQKKLTEILDYFDLLKKVDTNNVKPCFGGTEQENIFREDQGFERENQEELINQAPQKKDNLIKTKRILP